jgi:hypothetical protein
MTWKYEDGICFLNAKDYSMFGGKFNMATNSSLYWITFTSWQLSGSKLRIINNSQIYSTIIDTMGQTFPVGILLLDETGVPEETHESTASHRQTLSHIYAL